MARSLVVGASGGIGAALVAALEARGDDVVALSRSADGLDVTDAAAVARVMGALDGAFDMVVVATGALVIGDFGPEKSLKTLDAAGMAAQFALNAVGPMLVLQQALRVLPKDRPARVGILSARVGSIGDNALGGWYSYRTAKAALNQLVHTAAIEMARSHRQAVVALLHPGTVDTAFTAAYQPAYQKLTPAQAAEGLLAVLDGLTPAQSGGFFDVQGQVVPW